MNVDMIMADAHRMLRENPGTWTSYAELCEAQGLSRQLALVLARAIIPGGNTPEIYFRLRNVDGVYNPGNHERSTANVEPTGDSGRSGSMWSVAGPILAARWSGRNAAG